MRFEFNTDKGVFPGISVQLFCFDTPVTQVVDETCHALPMSVGAYGMENVAENKCVVFFLEDSMLDSGDDEDELREEFRPYGGDFWVFDCGRRALNDMVDDALAKHGTPEWQPTMGDPTHYHLEDGEFFHDRLIALGAEGKL